MRAARGVTISMVCAIVAAVGCDRRAGSGDAESARAAAGVTTTRPDAASVSKPASPKHALTPDDQIREVVFRHDLARWASAGAKLEYVFLDVGKGRADPSAELLARFDGHVPPVEPVSSCSSGDGVRHKRDGGRGIILEVRSIRHLDEDTAEVEGGYYENGLSAEGSTYQLKRRDGKWVVTGRKLNWVS
jgi:hypothetical protein